MAVVCGFVAVAVGVVGVIIMTRQLVDEDDPYPSFSKMNLVPDNKKPSNCTKFRRDDTLPTISEEGDDDDESDLVDETDVEQPLLSNHDKYKRNLRTIDEEVEE